MKKQEVVTFNCMCLCQPVIGWLVQPMGCQESAQVGQTLTHLEKNSVSLTVSQKRMKGQSRADNVFSDLSVWVLVGSRKSRCSEPDPGVVGGWGLAAGRWAGPQWTGQVSTGEEKTRATLGTGSGS